MVDTQFQGIVSQLQLLITSFQKPSNILAGEVAKELVESRKHKGIAPQSVDYLKYHLDVFGRWYSGPIYEMNASHVESFLASLGVAARTKNNYLAVIRQLVNYARKREYLPPGWDALGRIEEFREPCFEPVIYAPDELRRILAECGDILPGVCLVAFSGVRTAEMCRLEWSACDVPGRIVAVAASKAKTRSRRLCPIPDNLAAWLNECDRPAGKKIWPKKRREFSDLLSLAIKKAGVTPRRNGLRHSFVSYRMAAIQDAAQVADESGHTEEMLYANYRAVVTAREAEEYFAILPPVQRRPQQP